MLTITYLKYSHDRVHSHPLLWVISYTKQLLTRYTHAHPLLTITYHYLPLRQVRTDHCQPRLGASGRKPPTVGLVFWWAACAAMLGPTNHPQQLPSTATRWSTTCINLLRKIPCTSCFWSQPANLRIRNAVEICWNGIPTACTSLQSPGIRRTCARLGFWLAWTVNFGCAQLELMTHPLKASWFILHSTVCSS